MYLDQMDVSVIFVKNENASWYFKCIRQESLLLFQGPLSLLIRHSERARDYEFFVSLHEGLLYLAINDAADLIGAYAKAKKNTV